jgi:hypothetical protein
MKARAILMAVLVLGALLATGLARAIGGERAAAAGPLAAGGPGDSLLENRNAVDGTYDLSWWTVDGGGGTFTTAGGLWLSNTAGQPDAGLLAVKSYTLRGGFWRDGAVAVSNQRVYLPLVLRQR